MAPKPRFTDGEKVLCFHGPLLYEAKCLRSQIRDKHMKYFIHYSGWNKNWDEWVPECRVLKYNDVNLTKQKDLAKTHMKSKKSKNVKLVVKKEVEKEKEIILPPLPEKTLKPKPEKKLVPSPPSIKQAPIKAPPIEQCKAPPPEPIETKKVKPKIERHFVEEASVEVEIKVTVSPALQSWLVDDWDLVTRQKKILQLPARITVDHIIASYVREKVSVKGLSQTMELTIVQVANRLRDCFNVLLGKSLLYKFERPQYSEMLVEYKELRMCQIYGAIHLLRMFTNLGSMLTSIAAPGSDISPLMNHVEDFIRYMSTNPTFFSLDDYVVASPEYHRRALG